MSLHLYNLSDTLILVLGQSLFLDLRLSEEQESNTYLHKHYHSIKTTE